MKIGFGPTPRVVPPEKLGGVVWPASQTLTLFMIKICDIPFPIYDQTEFEPLFMT